MQPRLQADQLRVSRAGHEVLRGVSFAVDAGQIYALLGGNGAGKSTTLLTFLGFLPPSGGKVLVQGEEVGANLSTVRSALAYLPEAASLYDHLNAYENLRYFLRLAGLRTAQAGLDDALEQVSLPAESRPRALRHYSKGMRQKVAIALALLRNTEILLLDEPTAGLDPAAIDEFHALVRGLADAGKTILMVTHDVYGACQVADRISLLRAGEMAGEFAAQNGERIATEAVHRAFAGQRAAQAA
ncbi:MAG: ABC transporter ATP-binding protein [Cellvibrionales bacterium]|nr:ABC transporter ATP-binding protein [Cellvibrionales bacterium]